MSRIEQSLILLAQCLQIMGRDGDGPFMSSGRSTLIYEGYFLLLQARSCPSRSTLVMLAKFGPGEAF